MARIFAIASVEEHWGLVVHEAALSGCVLCVSEKVGSADDLLDEINGRTFNPYDVADIARKLREMMSFDDDRLRRAHSRSIELASRIGLDVFVRGVARSIGT